MKDIKLKSCPFCGSDAEIAILGGDYSVVCTKCHGAMFPFRPQTMEDAVNAWNTRIQSNYVEDEI